MREANHCSQMCGERANVWRKRLKGWSQSRRQIAEARERREGYSQEESRLAGSLTGDVGRGRPLIDSVNAGASSATSLASWWEETHLRREA